MGRISRITTGVIILLTTLTFTSVRAQDPDNNTLSKGTIEEQFEYITNRSTRYQDFKVIKETSLKTLQSNILDTLKKLKNNLKENNTLMASHKANIDSVKAQLQSTNNKLDETYREKNSIRFLGMLMSKEAFTKMMWIIVGILAIVLAIFVILFKRSNKVTLLNKATLQETREEFDKYRKRALEREQELSRNHLAELNKYRRQTSGS
jgi:hypothetical protein